AALLGMRERTIVLDGFSKIYAMTGWRLGYGLFPKEMAPAIARLMSNSNSCTAAFTQIAGVAALTGPQEPSEAMVDEFHRRRDVIVRGLNEIPGVTCRTPHGAFYVFPNITDTGLSSREAADLLLQEAGVAALSGTAFGEYGEGYIRLSYANSVGNIEKALDRIKQTLSARHGKRHVTSVAGGTNGKKASRARNGSSVPASASATRNGTSKSATSSRRKPASVKP
ncbi:MAG: aminotransferase class I/II-fold pyridoxal phosphate-dependent enzyme, partial [Ktedonobacterales bacterium]